MVSTEDPTTPELIRMQGRMCMPAVIVDSVIPAGTIFQIAFIASIAQLIVAGIVIGALFLLNVI